MLRFLETDTNWQLRSLVKGQYWNWRESGTGERVEQRERVEWRERESGTMSSCEALWKGRTGTGERVERRAAAKPCERAVLELEREWNSEREWNGKREWNDERESGTVRWQIRVLLMLLWWRWWIRALLMLPRRSFTGSSFTINLSQRTGNHVPKNGSEKNLED